MLRELTIENFALIDQLRLEFGPGFTVLTGETGAGKSIIIDALNAVLGERVGADAIRGGETRATIEAVFDAADAPRALAALEEAGLRDGEDSTLIVTREIASGRSYYRLNRRASTLAVLQEVGRHLVDIHGQHEHQTLIHEENHLSFLDVFGVRKHLEMRARYETEFDAFRAALKALQDVQMDERERAQRADMLRFQVEEIDKAGLEPDEEETLRGERLRLQHAERIREAVTTACALLDGETEAAPAALAAVETAEQELKALADVDSDLASTAQELETAGVVIQEVVRSLSGHLEAVQSDPQRLEEIERRLADIAGLKRKYGDSIAEILSFRDRAATELSHLENIETSEQELRAELEQRREQAGEVAEQLSAARAKLVRRLREAVEAELVGLGMEAATFDVTLQRVQDPDGLPTRDGQRCRATRRGIDVCSFQFSANAGEPLKPLSKVASGGELSRLMLVFKSICSKGAEIATIAFDEVDVGIGGRVAHAVGEKLAGVSAGAQVLCVTHLPQIARLADDHIRVSKEVESGRTIVQAERLDETGRVSEVARMLGAEERDATARQHAEEMLRDAASERETIRAKAAEP